MEARVTSRPLLWLLGLVLLIRLPFLNQAIQGDDHIYIAEAEHAILQIEDTGPGIPAEERTRVFDRFYRLPGSSADGSGLGLAIAKQVADAHGGDIVLDDAAGGQGLRVTVRFKLALIV